VFSLAKKLIPLGIALAMIAAVLTPSFAAPARAGGITLLVYSHLQQSESPVIENLAKGWEAKTGNTVKVVYDSSSFQNFTTLARTGKGPDVGFGYPHDNMGTFQLAGLVSPVPDGVWNPGDYVPLAVPAVSFGGQAFSVPLLVDSTTLQYNKHLVPTAPKTWNDVIKIASTFGNKKGQPYGLLFPVNNYYYVYAFISGLGGYTFAFKNGAYDPTNIGLDNAGTIQALQFLGDLVTKYKLIPADLQYNTEQSLFQKGQAAMVIDGSWDVGANKAALGKNFAVTTLPLLNGKVLHPYASVQVAFVNAFSHHQAAAWDFIKYIAPLIGVPDWKVAGRFPAYKAALDDPAITSDPASAAFANEIGLATPMPNIAAMNTVWTPAGNALTLVITGKSTPQQAAANMVKQIKQGIAQQTQ
jgi:arabinogalactan oligomer/maltooligosaccharide transport system substrate-binding protein